MTRSLLLALLISAVPASAQTVQPKPVPVKPVPAQVAQLRDAALEDDYAWDITEGLTTEVGQRLAGTEAEARARGWAVAKLRSLGFSNVRVDTFDMPLWIRGEEKAWVTAPFPQPLRIGALG